MNNDWNKDQTNNTITNNGRDNTKNDSINIHYNSNSDNNNNKNNDNDLYHDRKN